MTPCVIDIGIATYRRHSLAETLASLAHQRLPEGVTMRVIVADNDEEPSAQVMVAGCAEKLGLHVVYRHAPARNISIARNACLDAASGDYLAFIDDDEIASPDWLAELLAVAEASRAEAVLGPMQAIYLAEAPAWLRAGDYHSTRPVFVRGAIETGYTTNVLLRRAAPTLAPLRFREAFGITGGEDTDYFRRLTRVGGRIAYAEAALTYEGVPPTRATFGWLWRRRTRYGETHAALLREEGKAGAKAQALVLAKASYCFARAVLVLPLSFWRNYWLLRGALHWGAWRGLLN